MTVLPEQGAIVRTQSYQCGVENSRNIDDPLHNQWSLINVVPGSCICFSEQGAVFGLQCVEISITASKGITITQVHYSITYHRRRKARNVFLLILPQWHPITRLESDYPCVVMLSWERGGIRDVYDPIAHKWSKYIRVVCIIPPELGPTLGVERIERPMSEKNVSDIKYSIHNLLREDAGG